MAIERETYVGRLRIRRKELIAGEKITTSTKFPLKTDLDDGRSRVITAGTETHTFSYDIIAPDTLAFCHQIKVDTNPELLADGFVVASAKSETMPNSGLKILSGKEIEDIPLIKKWKIPGVRNVLNYRDSK